jgi:hypothetical protein
MDPADFPYVSTGTLLFDPAPGTKRFEPWWALLLCDQQIIDYYAWLLLRRGIAIHKGSAWGAHVCFVRGEEPADKSVWGVDPGPVTFHYSNVVRWDNGYHAWLNVWCPALTEIRNKLGLKARARTYYHLTLGRLVFERANASSGYDFDDTLIL